MDIHCGNASATNSAPRRSTCVKSWRDGPSAIFAADSTLVQIATHDHSAACSQILPVSMFASGALELPFGRLPKTPFLSMSTKAAVPQMMFWNVVTKKEDS